MLKILTYLLIVILINIQDIWSTSTADKLANLEIERINNQNINSLAAQRIINNNTQEIDQVLTGATGEINFNRCASVAEWEQARIHVLNKYITSNKILGQNKSICEYALNNINENLLANNALKKKYSNHLFSLYILEYAAYKITQNDYSYLSGKTQFNESISGRFFKDWKKGVKHHSFIQNYITNNFETTYGEKFQIHYDKKNKFDNTNHYYSSKFKSTITRILGDNFMGLYHGLILNLNNVAPEEKEAIRFMHDYNQSPYQNIKLNAPKYIENLNISSHELNFLTELRSSYEKVARTDLTNSQSVHQYNQSFVKPNVAALIQIQQNFSVIIEKLNKGSMENNYKHIKEDIQQFLSENGGRLNPYTSNSDVKNSITTTFKNLDKHFSDQGFSEKSETGLDVLALLEQVYLLSKKMDGIIQARNEQLKAQYLDNIYIKGNIDLNLKLLKKLNSKELSYFDDFVLSFAANHYDGGWCYPGIAGRLFRDYCKILTDFILDSPDLIKTITIENIKQSLQLR